MPFDNAFLINQLKRPKGIADVVMDTDAYNEIDDQYAISYMLLSPEKLNALAIYAAPFSNRKAKTPREGMEKSYDEILNIVGLCGRPDMRGAAYKGSPCYLPDEKTPVNSDAARDLVKRALAHSPEKPLYIAAIGAITNVASALLMNPAIAERIVVIFLGGHAHDRQPRPEFNMTQDIAACRVVFGSGAPLVQLPCHPVVSHLSTTEPELREHLKGKSPLGDYLYKITCADAVTDGGNDTWSRVIWDISTVAWLLSENIVSDILTPAPIPSYDNGYVIDRSRHFIKVAAGIDRDAVFSDLFRKIKGTAAK